MTTQTPGMVSPPGAAPFSLDAIRRQVLQRVEERHLDDRHGVKEDDDDEEEQGMALGSTTQGGSAGHVSAVCVKCQ